MTVLQLKKPVDYNCPPWCQSTDHGPGELEANDGLAMHFGPEFGLAWVQQMSGEPFTVMLALEDHTEMIEDTARLREMAADLLRAAEWIEAHQ